ncbi:hypothetical protein [Sulfurimonas sp.]|uniref:hypothetical protein n=1 Tax=Sulfurimonas sp. TaxID=2022749 RepID=UPI002B49ED81|nr:hypothetical protein [Sulfurimonas sp.]
MDLILYPLKKLILLIIDIPFFRHQYTKRGIADPAEMIESRTKKFTENPKLSLATIIGGGISMSVVMTLYIGFYNITRNLLFPTFEDFFGYVLTVTGSLAFITDMIFVKEKYFKEFNNKKGWWRIKWSIITALSPFVVILFAIATIR